MVDSDVWTYMIFEACFGMVALSIYNLVEALVLTIGFSLYLALSKNLEAAFIVFWVAITKPVPNFGIPNIISCTATFGLTAYADLTGRTEIAGILGGWCALIMMIAYAMKPEVGDFLELNRAMCRRRNDAGDGCATDEAALDDDAILLREHLLMANNGGNEEAKEDGDFIGDII